MTTVTKIKKCILGISILSSLCLMAGCDNPFLKDKIGSQKENVPPETYLFLHFKSDTLIFQDSTYQSGQPIYFLDTVITTLDTTSSNQKIYWWGEDTDGEVIGYYYKWDYQDELTFTTAEAGTFYVPIRQKYDIFEFEVYAVDDDSAIDPIPAKLSFPVYNTTPTISFRNKSNPGVTSSPNVTSFTFTTRTFVWDALDADGNETIREINWALDDTTQWNVIERTNNVLPDYITLTDRVLSEGYHTFFVKAKDVAGAESNTIMFPDTTDEAVPNRWYVREPRGNVLLVDDFAQDQTYKTTQLYYSNILDGIVGENNYSVWEIGSTSTNTQNSLPYTSTDIVANLSYFDKVIWFSFLGVPHISDAGLSITKYIKDGGRIFITNGNEQIPDTTWAFTAIDSVYRLNPGGRLYKGVEVEAHFGDSSIDDSLTLITAKLIGNRVSALIPRDEEGVSAVYTMIHPDSTEITVPYTGIPAVGIHYAPPYITGESIYFSLPLDYCDGYANVKDLLDYILNVEFND